VPRPVLRRLLLLTVLGAAIGAGLSLADLASTKDTLGGLVTSSAGRPQSAVILADLPEESRTSGGSHDGAYYYVVARDPFSLAESAGSFDIPRYRMQRILFPVAVWALHPTGGGPGLVWTMFAVNVAGLLLGGFVTGRLSLILGGPMWPALLVGPMFGSVVSLRISVGDALALALVILTFILSLQRHNRWAVAAAAAAALTKETSLLILFGFALWRRDKEGLSLFGVALAVTAAWWAWLAVNIGGSASAANWVPPFSGWVESWSFWTTGPEPLGFLSFVTGVGIAGAALLLTRPSHPLWWPLALTLASTSFYAIDVIAPERNASRMVLPLQILGVVAIVTRSFRGTGTERSSLVPERWIRRRTTSEVDA